MSAGSRKAFVALAASAGLIVVAVFAQERPDYTKLKAVLNGNVPRTVEEFPFSAFPIATRSFFDYFMWENFIALMWPSRPRNNSSW